MLCCAVLCSAVPCCLLFRLSHSFTQSTGSLTHCSSHSLTYSQVQSLATHLQPRQPECVKLTQLHAVCSVAFILQSTAFSCEHLESRCEAFLQQFHSSLEQMTDESFKTQVGL